ncbi:Acad9 [Symbiodinium sp. KB8]|nr:Acad9 [Symbiodinium sp. KB8]
MLARAATAASAVARSAVRAPAGPAMRMWGGRAASTEAAPKKKSRVLPKDEQSFVRRMFYGDVVGKQILPYPQVLDEEQTEMLSGMVDPVEKFFAEIPSAQIDIDGKIDDGTMQGLKDLGLFGLQIPEEFNGLGLNNTSYSRIVEEIVLDASCAVTLMAHQSIGLKGIIMDGTPEQKAKYLPRLATGEHLAAFALTEPGSGSDAASIQTRATPSEDGKSFKLNGGKMWISNGGLAQVFTVFARTAMPDGTDKITAFIVDKDFGGVIPGKPETKLGIKGSNTVQLTFEDCVVPAENVLGEVGGGFKVAMKILNNGRFGLGAGTGGAIKKLIRDVSTYANERKQFGAPLASFGMIQEKFTNMAVQAYAIESMVYATTALIDGPGLDASVEAAICKIYGSEAMFEAVNEAIQVLGGLGFASGVGAAPYERYMRDSRILLIFEGTNEILRMFTALSCIQGPGEDLSAVGKGGLGAQASYALKRLQRDLGMGEGLEGVHSSLSSEADFFKRATGSFANAVDDLLMKHKKDIINQQRPLKRVADIAIDLYAVACSLSRCTRALERGDATAEHQTKLVKLLVAKARERITANLLNIRNDGGKQDKLCEDIATEILREGKYLPPHPLGV